MMSDSFPSRPTAIAMVLGMMAVAGGVGPALADASKLYDMAPLLQQPYPLSSVPASRAAATAYPAYSATPGRPQARPAAPTAAAAAPATDFVTRPHGWYLRGEVGAVLGTGASNSGQVNFESDTTVGFGVGGGGGFAWENGIRVEGLVHYDRRSLDSINVTSTGGIPGLAVGSQNADGSVSALALLVNAAYDFNTGTDWVPYLIGGAGYAEVSMNDAKANGVLVADDSDWVPAFNVGAGVQYKLNKSWAADVGYRYLFTFDPDFRDAAGNKFDSEYDSHNFSAGVRYTFN
jgi:opacity protein-like surface antigen